MISGGRRAQDALCRVASARAMGSGTWAEIATKAIDEITKTRALCEVRDADLKRSTSMLRESRQKVAEYASREIAAATALGLLGAPPTQDGHHDIVGGIERLKERAEKAERAMSAGTMHYEIKVDTAAARAQLAELQAAVEAQAEAAKKASEQQAAITQTTSVGDPRDPITVARALLKQAADESSAIHRLALITEARQWAALAGV